MNLPGIDIEKLKITAVTKKGTEGKLARRRLAILERDGFKCVTCGKSENLTISHTVPIYGKKRNHASSFKFDECITQCSECHLKEEYNRTNLRLGHVFRWT